MPMPRDTHPVAGTGQAGLPALPTRGAGLTPRQRRMTITSWTPCGRVCPTQAGVTSLAGRAGQWDTEPSFSPERPQTLRTTLPLCGSQKRNVGGKRGPQLIAQVNDLRFQNNEICVNEFVQ